ncbi:MAG: YicC family protein [Gammaproteobacteria bacterium]|nr:YicC family protein [Gammaproteobacteria bacterium]
MINSMTAFSRSSEEQVWGSLVWELRSVNHRYLDVVIKLPEEIRSIENEVRKRLNKTVKRGKIECNLRFKAAENQQSKLIVNEACVDEVLNACKTISTKLRQPSEMDVLELLKWPGVLDQTEIDLNPVINSAYTLFDEAVKNLVESREDEGRRLQVMIEERCRAMKKIVSNERQRRPQLLEKTRQKLLKKVEELKVDHDKDRFEQELVYITQKMDVDEELDRLDSHFIEVEEILKRNEPVGRRLDFIMQEFNREANTLGSKSADIETTQAAVELKVLIEQMREQVQNIE